MARKRPMQTAEVATEVKPVRVELTPDVHRLLRLVAADAGTSMAEYARTNLTEAIKAAAKAKGFRG